MKICLASRFFDLRNTGIGRFSVEMLEGLRRRGHEVTALAAGGDSDAGYFFYTAFELGRRLPKGLDVYHCLTPMEAIHAPKQSSIVTFHDMIPLLHLDKTETHYTQGRMKNLRRFVSRRYFGLAAKAASKCRVVVCTSDQAKRELVEHLSVEEERVKVVRLGIARGLEPAVKKDKVFRIGTLSYLDRRKRIDVLIKAFLDANVDGELVIGGKGADRDRLVDLAGGDSRIKFAGFVPEEKMSDFYNSLDLFVFPTRIEGYGMPIVEAFACKKPVLVLEDGVIPVELKSRCLVTDNLLEFLRRPAAGQQRDIEGNYRFARLHDWDASVGQYLRLYEIVVAEAGQK